MAIAKRSKRRVGMEDEADSDRPALGHAAAIERLREIAAQGLDDPALDGLDKSEREAGTGVAAGFGMPDSEVAVRAHMRIVEALLFAAPQPLAEKKIAEQLPPETDVRRLIDRLVQDYTERGVHLVRVAGKWAFRTADDLSYLLEKYAIEERRLSKAGLETLAIIAYHQPVTRAEIEEIRGVQTSRGTLDVLMETNWIRPRGRRRAPGKPLTYGTTDEFLSHFGLDGLGDLPGLAELKGAGLLDADLPPDFAVPSPKDVAALLPDELPLGDDAGAPDELDVDGRNDDLDEGPEVAGDDDAREALPQV